MRLAGGASGSVVRADVVGAGEVLLVVGETDDALDSPGALPGSGVGFAVPRPNSSIKYACISSGNWLNQSGLLSCESSSWMMLETAGTSVAAICRRETGMAVGRILASEILGGVSVDDPMLMGSERSDLRVRTLILPCGQ